MESEPVSLREIRGEERAGPVPPAKTAAQTRVWDKLGQEILPGSWIVYGHERGLLRIGRVLQIVLKMSASPYRAAASLEDVQMTVQGVDDDWREAHRCARTGVLQYPNRVVVLPAEMVPERYRKLIEGEE